MEHADSFQEVFIKLCKELNSSQLVNFAMTSWSIWKKRNLKLWENKDESPDQAVHRAQGVLRAWHMARQRADTAPEQKQISTARWTAPRRGYVKCNIDVAMSTADGKVSMGACLRDENGQFISAMTNVKRAVMTVAEAEAEA
jgi:hypothetical protein